MKNNDINQIKWRVLPQAPSLPPINKNATDWVDSDVPYESELRSNQIVWEELPEEDQIWYRNYQTVMGSKFEYKGESAGW